MDEIVYQIIAGLETVKNCFQASFGRSAREVFLVPQNLHKQLKQIENLDLEVLVEKPSI